MRTTATALFLLITSAGYAAAVPPPPPDGAAPAPAGGEPSGAHTEVHAFGHQPTDLTLELAPAQIERRGGKDALRVDLRAVSHAAAEISAVVAYEVRDDLGNLVVPERISPRSKLARGAAVDHANPGVPAGLADGYYFARATGAWSGDRTNGTTSAYLYFAVDAGRISVVDASDWQQLSRVQEGVVR